MNHTHLPHNHADAPVPLRGNYTTGLNMQHIEEVKNILADVLGLNERVRGMNENSALLGSVPELDSMAVISVLTALEEHFGISVDDDEISAGTFETLGTLVRFVEQKLAA
jgi:acyl carrier protein